MPPLALLAPYKGPCTPTRPIERLRGSTQERDALAGAALSQLGGRRADAERAQLRQRALGKSLGEGAHARLAKRVVIEVESLALLQRAVVVGVHQRRRQRGELLVAPPEAEVDEAPRTGYLVQKGTLVDARDHVLDAVSLPCHSGRQNVAVVTATHRCECMSARDPRILQSLAVETDPLDGDPAEIGSQLAEGLGVLINDGYRVALVVEFTGEQ